MAAGTDGQMLKFSAWSKMLIEENLDKNYLGLILDLEVCKNKNPFCLLGCTHA